MLASQQLSLGGNVQAALAGLQVADGKLARLDRPQLAPLRRALARDMDRLKAVPYVDVAGISIKLDQLIGAIDTLPLAKDERLPPPTAARSAADEPPWLRFLRDVWNDLRSVIRIEVSDRPAAPLVTPQQSFFLRENLRLRLLVGAPRAAVARRARVQGRLRRRRAGGSSSTSICRASRCRRRSPRSRSSRRSPMPGEMPDLAASLDAVRTLKAVGRAHARACRRRSAK